MTILINKQSSPVQSSPPSIQEKKPIVNHVTLPPDNRPHFLLLSLFANFAAPAPSARPLLGSDGAWFSYHFTEFGCAIASAECALTPALELLFLRMLLVFASSPPPTLLPGRDNGTEDVERCKPPRPKLLSCAASGASSCGMTGFGVGRGGREGSGRGGTAGTGGTCTISWIACEPGVEGPDEVGDGTF